MAIAEGITSTIEFQMSLLLFVALAGYLLAARINQSAVIGAILVGLFMGPSVLGVVTYTEFVSSIAHLGAIILLFVVGFEFKVRDIFQIRYFWVALLGVIVPWIGGFFVSRLFGFTFAEAVFVGTALTATSIAITANVLREMGKLQTEVAKAIIGAAVIDDVLSLVALSLAQEMVGGSIPLIPALLLLVKAAVFLIGGLLIGIYAITPLVHKVDSGKLSEKFPEFVFIFALCVAFVYAMAAELVGLSAIVGSFIAGVSFERVRIKRSKHYAEGTEYLNIIFASIFFVSLGVLADINALTSEIVLFLIVLTVVAMLTKMVGCGIPALFMGLKAREALTLGVGMAPRGEVAMIVALIGLNEGLIGQNIYVALVLMSLLTTIVTPLALRPLMKTS